MELLNYPFHDPPQLGRFRIAKESNEPCAEAFDATLEHAPGPSSVPAINLLPASPTKSERELGLSAPSSSLASSFPPPSIFEESESQSVAGSYTSSIILTRKTNKAFNKLRTAYDDEKPVIPPHWIDYQPPSLKQGHWRTFGPVLLRCWSVQAEPGKAKDARSKIQQAPSGSCAPGTVWITGNRVVFVLSKDAVPVSHSSTRPDQGKKGITGRFSWLRFAGKRDMTDSPRPEEAPLPATVDGHRLSGVQLDFSNICLLKHSKGKAGARTSISLSRSSSRANASSSIDFLGSTSETSNLGLSDGCPKVIIDAQDAQRYVRWELSFESVLYAQEAGDLMERLESMRGRT